MSSKACALPAVDPALATSRMVAIAFAEKQANWRIPAATPIAVVGSMLAMAQDRAVNQKCAEYGRPACETKSEDSVETRGSRARGDFTGTARYSWSHYGGPAKLLWEMPI